MILLLCLNKKCNFVITSIIGGGHTLGSYEKNLIARSSSQSILSNRLSLKYYIIK